MASAGDSGGAASRDLVCVTGGSGFIGSWLVRLLLDRGYTVHGTVKNITLYPVAQVDKSFLGSLILLFQNELLEPAVKGTLNVLRTAKDCGVGRVVLMSSQAAMVPNPNWPADKVIDDDSWADVELLKKVQFWYSVSKTLAEKAAWDFAAKEGLRMAVLNPGM
ncbi:hypothetical protein BAE44_0018365, partial [Dichanthelium oligosanthes]